MASRNPTTQAAFPKTKKGREGKQRNKGGKQ